MKTYLITLALIFTCSLLYAQSGIYATAEDYLNGNLQYSKENFRKHAVRADIPFNPSAVKVRQGSERYVFDKWNLYGYKNKRNQDFRFYESKAFRIVDADHFPVYAREENVVHGKEKTRVTKYYFSRNAESPLLELTIGNLKHAFPNRHFHDWIDLQFRKNTELMAYDSHYGEYKLKSIYNRIYN